MTDYTKPHKYDPDGSLCKCGLPRDIESKHSVGSDSDQTRPTVEQILHNHYDQIFDEIVSSQDDVMYDLAIEYKDIQGKTVRISWLDRENRLKENE